ncbi:development-specific protein LVN1.2-like [Acanthaster planci]|uniref:Development-specific protein LVN1.2-like n=1 Tax=Acanthaster planci TaxID=133434 RepID=A0A8B7ZBJ6_ACAPL|nr:development-specific protein LVN1.2-like [Acanthaster planci]
MEVKSVFLLLLVVVATSLAQKKCCFPKEFEALDGQVVGTISAGKPVAVLESIQFAFDYFNQRAGEFAFIQDGAEVYMYQIIVDYKAQTEYIIQAHTQTCQKIPLPAGTNMSHCVPDDATYESSFYVGDNKMTADSFTYSLKQGVVAGNVILSVSKGDCIPYSVTFFGQHQGTPVLQVTGFVNYTSGIQDPARYFTVPEYCMEQSFSQAPKMYNSFIHLFV